MLVESIVAASVASLLYSANKSIETDDAARAKYAKAFTKEAEAQQLVYEKKLYADKRIENVVKKKRAIINVSLPMFVKVYEQIQKVNIERKDINVDLLGYSEMKKFNILSYTEIVSKKDFSDKELVLGIALKGISGMMIEDSKRNMSAANSQMSASNVVYSQAKSISELYDAIAERSNRIAKLLTRMNVLFISSISETENTINRNGFDVRNYSDRDKATLMMCVNIAKAMPDLLKIPVVNENGKITQAAIDMLLTGEESLNKFNEIINQ